MTPEEAVEALGPSAMRFLETALPDAAKADAIHLVVLVRVGPDFHMVAAASDAMIGDLLMAGAATVGREPHRRWTEPDPS